MIALFLSVEYVGFVLYVLDCFHVLLFICLASCFVCLADCFDVWLFVHLCDRVVVNLFGCV